MLSGDSISSSLIFVFTDHEDADDDDDGGNNDD